MSRLYVEGWAPEYGASVEPDEELRAAEGSVDVDVEDRPWNPVDGVDDGIPMVAFVDGVRRIDARLVLDADTGPVPGICGTHAVGAVLWDRTERRSEIIDVEVTRLALLASGSVPEMPPLGLGITFESAAVADDDPAALVRSFHDSMRRTEANRAEILAQGGYFVVADGPLYEYTATDKMGYVKSHRRSYLPDAESRTIAVLGRGQRTPIFAIGEGRFRRYSWYLRLAERGGGHSWTGIVRCEASEALGVDRAVTIADRSAAVLPLVASEGHIDPRAPQNLVPIAALERRLRHLMGDPGLVIRALRSAMGAAA
jgi:hypothetical protein